MSCTNHFFDIILPSYFRESEFTRNGNKYLEFRSEDFHQMDGFQSEMYKGNVYFEDNNGNINNSKSLLIKTLSENNWNKLIDVSFANELFMYNRMLPFFYSLNHTLAELFPKFYHGESTFGDKYSGIQILENLQEVGYRMTDSKTTLDIKHLLLMVKKLGEFHAYSYQAKKQQPEMFFQLVDNLKETCGLLIYDKDILTPLFEYHLEHLATLEKYQPEIEVIRNMIKNPIEFIEKIYSTRREPIAVLCHGDFLRNNVLFKYDSENNPIDIKFIDLANSRYCSPVTDLGLVLYMHSDQETRDQYWDQLIDSYYDALKNTFPDNDLVPTKSEILEEFRESVLQPYLTVMFFLPLMITSEEHSAPDWFTRYFSPEHEEYKYKEYESPHYVLQKAWLNLLNKSKICKVLNVLVDIINRGFVQ